MAPVGVVSGNESLSLTPGCTRIGQSCCGGKNFAAQINVDDRTHPSGTAIKLVDDLGNGLSGKVMARQGNCWQSPRLLIFRFSAVDRRASTASMLLPPVLPARSRLVETPRSSCRCAPPGRCCGPESFRPACG